ncbi:hypothetical protein FRB95_014669 [Tulasnella sp. JGI-2019a]|nr:hypothetical protein FRB95_014669 [Tulasnella sp. JGI-2019a]
MTMIFLLSQTHPIVLCTSESPPPLPLSPLELPIESISSMKMILGACSLAITNNSPSSTPLQYTSATIPNWTHG